MPERKQENYAALTQDMLDPIRKLLYKCEESNRRIKIDLRRRTALPIKEVSNMETAQALDSSAAFAASTSEPYVLTVANGHRDLMTDDWTDWAFANPVHYDNQTWKEFLGRKPVEQVIYQALNLVSEYYANK